MRGKAACNCQGLGALPGVELCFPSLRVADFIGSSQARWFAQRFFPLTPPSPLGRGRIARRVFANPERLDSLQRGMRCSLSLRERARVRGNETLPIKTAGRILRAQLDRRPESKLAVTLSPKPVDSGSAQRQGEGPFRVSSRNCKLLTDTPHSPGSTRELMGGRRPDTFGAEDASAGADEQLNSGRGLGIFTRAWNRRTRWMNC